MNYILSPSAMTAPFFVPASVADEHLKLATGNQLKVLLLFLRNVTAGTDCESIAKFLKLPVSEVEDALEFWAQAGILTSATSPKDINVPEKSPKQQAVKPIAVKPTREEIAFAAASDNKLAFLLQEAEMKLSRTLRGSELQTLSWLYMDHGMDVSLILMIVEYAISEGKTTVSFIEATALAWIDAGVSTLAQAEEQIETRNRKKTAWGIVVRAFGTEHRAPSDKELEYAETWINQWGFSREMLKEAYNRCIDQKAKISMPYINGILEKWYKEGVKTPEAAKNSDNKSKKKSENSFSTYNKGLVDKLLNNDD